MRFLVFQHISIEHPGSFREFMDQDGVKWDVVELDEGEAIPDLSPYDALIVMGGPMDVWQEDAHPWLKAEKQAIEEAVLGRGLPYLGFCLGHQLLAVSLDGEAGPMSTPEVGLLSVTLNDVGRGDPLFRAMPATATALQWHAAEVKTLLADSDVLASSPACAVQSFKVGRHAYGIQYHLEMTADTVPEWSMVPEYQMAMESTLGEGALSQMERDVAYHLLEFTANAHQLYDNFVGIVKTA